MEQRSGILPGPDPPIGDQAGDEGNHDHAGAAVDHRGKGEHDFCQKSNHGHNTILEIFTFRSRSGHIQPI